MAERQKAIIVGVHYDQKEDFSNSMEELAQLAEACDIEVVGEVTQKLDRVHSAHYIGKGKLQELTALLAERMCKQFFLMMSCLHHKFEIWKKLQIVKSLTERY